VFGLVPLGGSHLEAAMRAPAAIATFMNGNAHEFPDQAFDRQTDGCCTTAGACSCGRR
jgi:hypothetical protein